MTCQLHEMIKAVGFSGMLEIAKRRKNDGADWNGNVSFEGGLLWDFCCLNSLFLISLLIKYIIGAIYVNKKRAHWVNVK